MGRRGARVQVRVAAVRASHRAHSPTGASAGTVGSLALMLTTTGHIAPSGGGQSFALDRKASFQTRPAGNAVNLEDEMLKVSANQMDYAAVTSLYSKSLHLLKTAIGKG